MLPCFGLAKREHLVECRDHTDQHSINQRLIYGLVGPGDAIINQSSKFPESLSSLKCTEYNCTAPKVGTKAVSR